MKTLFRSVTVMLLLISAIDLRAQGPNLPSYKMIFQFRNGGGVLKDTVMSSRLKFSLWGKSSDYPDYVKWKNQPFAVLQSNINGVGLFTDSTHSFSTGQTIGYAFFKVGASGTFELDYIESNIGSFVNNSDNPNMEVVSTSQGLILKAKQHIGPNTELTASYQSLINMFPNDPSVERTIKYW